MAATRAMEVGRAGLGAGLGLTICSLLVAALAPRLSDGLFLVAPLGASAVLLFAVPNSPLAQPWSAVVGNAVSAFWAVGVIALIPDKAAAIGIAVGGAIALMLLVRALHPPGGAVALYTVLEGQAGGDPGFGFALIPVAATTAALVCLAIAFNRLTGRRYPFRQPRRSAAAESPGTAKADAGAPMDAGMLAEILASHRLSANLGVEDLRRLIAAAELRTAIRPLDRLRAEDLMIRDPATLRAEAPLAEAAALLRDSGTEVLVVSDPAGRFRGLLGRREMEMRAGAAGLVAADVMTAGGVRAASDTPAGRLFELLSDVRVRAIPVLDDSQVIGLVSRAALVAAVARAGAAGHDHGSNTDPRE